MIVQTFKDFMYAVKQQYYAIKNQLYLKKIINDSKMHTAITECMVRKVITPDQFKTIFDVYDGKNLILSLESGEVESHFYGNNINVFDYVRTTKNGEVTVIHDDQRHLEEKMEELKNG